MKKQNNSCHQKRTFECHEQDHIKKLTQTELALYT